MKQAFCAFVRVRSSATLNLSWAGPGDLVIKRYFESGSESRQALAGTDFSLAQAFWVRSLEAGSMW